MRKREQAKRGVRAPARDATAGHPHGGTEPNRDTPKPEVRWNVIDPLEEAQRQHPDDYRSPK